jgi:hypothetical protein
MDLWDRMKEGNTDIADTLKGIYLLEGPKNFADV